MKRTFIVILLVACLAVPAVFGQLVFGVSGALYTDTKLSFNDTVSRFQDGDGIFYGPFVELGMNQLAIGLSGNFSFYTEDWGTWWTGADVYSFVDYDVSFYVQAHLFEYSSFLDFFGEAGVGQMGKDFRDDAQDPDPENPLYATNYFEAGLGLGINLGDLGFLWKTLYMFPGDPVLGTMPAGADGEYYLQEYPLKRIKIILGAKLML